MVGETGGEIASVFMEDVTNRIKLDFESSSLGSAKSFEKRTAFGTLEEEGATDEGCTADKCGTTDGGGAMIECAAVAE